MFGKGLMYIHSMSVKTLLPIGKKKSSGGNLQLFFAEGMILQFFRLKAIKDILLIEAEMLLKLLSEKEKQVVSVSGSFPFFQQCY